MISLVVIAALLTAAGTVAEPIPKESVARKEQPTMRPVMLPTLPTLPQMPSMPAIPTMPTIPTLPVPAIPAIVPQFLDVFSDGLSKVSVALRGPTPLQSLAPLLVPARPGKKPTRSHPEPHNA